MNLGTDGLLSKLDRLPPILCRFLAKHNGKLMSDVELARRTGWGNKKLRRVYQTNSWKNVTVEEVDSFLTACGLKWSAQRRQRWLLELAWSQGRLSKMRHLQKCTTATEVAMVNNLLRHMEKLCQ